MNSHSPADPLDRLLADWSQSREPDETAVESLQQQVVSALREEVESFDLRAGIPLAIELSSGKTASTKRRWRWGVGITAAALIIGAVVLRDHVMLTTPEREAISSERVAWQSPESLQQRAIMFQELQQLFDRRIRSVAESDETLTFDLLEEEESPVSLQSGPLSIRVVMQRRFPGTRNWTTRSPLGTTGVC